MLAQKSFLRIRSEVPKISVINDSKVLVLRDDGFEEVYSTDSILVISDETYSETAFKFIPNLSKEEKVKKKVSKNIKKRTSLYGKLIYILKN